MVCRQLRCCKQYVLLNQPPPIPCGMQHRARGQDCVPAAPELVDPRQASRLLLSGSSFDPLCDKMMPVGARVVTLAVTASRRLSLPSATPMLHLISYRVLYNAAETISEYICHP